MRNIKKCLNLLKWMFQKEKKLRFCCLPHVYCVKDEKWLCGNSIKWLFPCSIALSFKAIIQTLLRLVRSLNLIKSKIVLDSFHFPYFSSLDSFYFVIYSHLLTILAFSIYLFFLFRSVSFHFNSYPPFLTFNEFSYLMFHLIYTIETMIAGEIPKMYKFNVK